MTSLQDPLKEDSECQQGSASFARVPRGGEESLEYSELPLEMVVSEFEFACLWPDFQCYLKDFEGFVPHCYSPEDGQKVVGAENIRSAQEWSSRLELINSGWFLASLWSSICCYGAAGH